MGKYNSSLFSATVFDEGEAEVGGGRWEMVEGVKYIVLICAAKQFFLLS